MPEPWEVFGGQQQQREPWEVFGGQQQAAGQQQQQQQQPLSWSDVPGQALKNLGPSAYQFGSDMAQPFLHPIDTLSNIGDIGSGVAQKLGLKSGDEDVKYADAVGEHFAGRYGSMEGFKQALAKDPVGVAGDLSTVFTGGGSAIARAPGVVGRVGEIARTAGRVVDPLNAVTLPVRGATKVAEHSLGMLTGAGGQSVQAARLAGKEGGVASEALRDQMRGTAPIEDVVSDAHSALENMRQAKQSAYRQDQRALAQDQTILSWNDVDTALNDMSRVANFKGQSTSRSTQAVRDRIVTEIDRWKNLRASEYWTPEGFDALKKSIGDIRETIPFEQKSARLVAKQAYDAVRNTIAKQAPAYDRTMKAYERASTQMRELEKTFALGPNATTDTALRKLTSALRNNVNTNFGRRAQLAQQLQDAGAPQLMNKISGQALNSWTPRGLAMLAPTLGIPGLIGGAAAGGGLGTLLALPAFAATSPRLVGETARGIGAAQRRLAPLSRLAEPARQIGRLPGEEDDPSRPRVVIRTNQYQ